MNLRKLAFTNIKHNLKKYAVFFFAMWFCIFTTYTFLALTTSKSVSSQLESSGNYQSLFIGFGIAILIFTLFFLISSNNSFIRARKKEISMYSLFGMENAKIGRMLFLETLILGLIALATAITLGIFLSKLLTMILLKMVMSAYSGDITFTIEPTAIVITCIIYIVIFSLMGLSGRRLISRFALVDLFKGDKVSEGRSKGSYIMLILSFILILAGYYFAVSPSASVVVIMMLPVIIVVVIGTYLFFLGGFQKIMHLIKRNKKSCYKKTRLISISLLSHRSRTMATMMATIAILVAIGTTAIAFGYTLFQNAERQAYDMSVFDMYYFSDDDSLASDVNAVLEKNNVEITDEITFQRYVSMPKTVLSGGKIFDENPNILTYSESTYNRIAAADRDSDIKISLQPGEATILYRPNAYVDSELKDANLIYDDVTLSATFIRTYHSYNFGGGWYTVVLNDQDYESLMQSGAISTKLEDTVEYLPIVGINYKNALTSDRVASELKEVLERGTHPSSLAYYTYNDLLSMYGLLCFIGFFMCTVFMLMTASMLYFKQLTIATEEKKQYAMLRKIGMSPEEENTVVRKRLMPIFFFPLILGIIHSIFAMKGADTLMFSNMIVTNGNTFISVLKTSLVMYSAYTVVYTIFYFITKSQYKQTIR